MCLTRQGKKRVIQKCKGKEQLINSKAMRTLGVGSREGKRALAYENVRTGHFPTDPRQLGQDPTVFVSVLTGSQFATLLHKKLVASGVEPKVVVATNVNPKLVEGIGFP
ncbi:hypothetical protein F2Q70_00001635 [Brassica cretica]|uniref:Uncharacterized protein n=1 Tax=Brassica cretica TaxID=69181 RepID=A0A8S9IVE4_BRACR|nr:hypothetical protein F2Q70_00001635 [Brassica cretica]